LFTLIAQIFSHLKYPKPGEQSPNSKKLFQIQKSAIGSTLDKGNVLVMTLGGTYSK
jgi:hypothetical protein